MVCLAPQLFLLVYPHTNVWPPTLPATTSPSWIAYPGFLPLLLFWMNVSSVTPWLSDFHTVQFPGSSGCFLCLNLVLPLFWLCEEAQYVYLCLHLGWKSWSSFKFWTWNNRYFWFRVPDDILSIVLYGLWQWFPNLRVQHNHLEDLLTQVTGPTLVSQLTRSGDHILQTIGL